MKAAEKLGIEWHKMGDGFTWLSKDMEETIAAARAWLGAGSEKISAEYDLVILDEFTYPLHFGWLDTDRSDSPGWKNTNRPSCTW